MQPGKRSGRDARRHEFRCYTGKFREKSQPRAEIPNWINALYVIWTAPWRFGRGNLTALRAPWRKFRIYEGNSVIDNCGQLSYMGPTSALARRRRGVDPCNGFSNRRRSEIMTTDVDEGRIRAAAGADASVIGQIVEDAYRHYIPRIGKPPGPMLDDYSARVAEGVVWVIEDRSAIAGIIVLLPREGYLLLDNIAVAPARQGAGLGRRLLAFAEVEAVRRGYREIRLYTHRTMTENQRLYAAVGYEETGRGTEAGYERVFMRKRLVGSSVPLGERLDLSDPQRTTLGA